MDTSSTSNSSHVLFGDDIVIRRFESKDAPQFIELVGKVLIEFGFTPDPSNDSDFANLDSSYKSGELWVACEKASGKIIASVGYREMRGCNESAPLTAELRRLYVSIEYRRRGLGRMLLTAIEFRARIAGFRRMILESASELKCATILYEATGYSHCQLPCENLKTQRCDVVMDKSLEIDAAADSDVNVVDEAGVLFAKMPPRIARRGRMRILTFVVADLWQNNLLQREEDDSPAINIHAKSDDRHLSSFRRNTTRVHKNLMCEDSHNRFACTLYLNRLTDEQASSRKWISLEYSLQKVQASSIHGQVLQVFNNFLTVP